MATPNLVEPAEGASVASSAPPVESSNPNAAPAAGEGGAALPKELLQVPALQGLMAGSPPAISVNMADFEKRPEAKLILENKDWLMEAGIATYRSLGGDTGVLFNQLYVSGQEIQEADKAGKLQQIAPPFDAVNQQVASSGENHPALKHDGNVPKEAKKYQAPTPPQMASSASPMAPGAQKALAKARSTNLQPGGPTEGAVPVGGRLLNQVLKPVI